MKLSSTAFLMLSSYAGYVCVAYLVCLDWYYWIMVPGLILYVVLGGHTVMQVEKWDSEAGYVIGSIYLASVLSLIIVGSSLYALTGSLRLF